MSRRKKKSAHWGRLLHDVARGLKIPDCDVDLDFVAVLAAADLGVTAPSNQHDKWQILAKYRAHKAAEGKLAELRAQPKVVGLGEKVVTLQFEPIESKAEPEPEKGVDFYRTAAWRRVRYRALVEHGNACQCCGASPRKGFPLHVDHIKPRSKYPELALKLSNLQVMCPDCNLGKSNRDETDWRE